MTISDLRFSRDTSSSLVPFCSSGGMNAFALTFDFIGPVEGKILHVDGTFKTSAPETRLKGDFGIPSESVVLDPTSIRLSGCMPTGSWNEFHVSVWVILPGGSDSNHLFQVFPHPPAI